MKTKICNKCHKEKEITSFALVEYQYRRNTCIKCRNSLYRVYRANYCRKYKEKRKEWHHNWVMRNSEKMALINKKWRKNNPEKWNHINRAKQHERRTLGKIDWESWEKKLETTGKKCLSCGRNDVKLTIDHKIPVVLGGTNDISNLQPLCYNCNRKKFTKVIDYELNYLSI